MRQALAVALRVALAVPALALAQSVYWSPAAPPLVLVLVSALFALTVWRPSWGLVALAVLAPFGRMIAVVWLGGHPTRGTEALALAVLAGLAARYVAKAPGPQALPARLSGPWVLFAIAVVASAAVLCRVTQFHHDYPAEFLVRLADFVATGYHGLPGEPRLWAKPVGFEYVASAALVVEGIVLMLAAGRLCQVTPGLSTRLVAATVIAGTVAATLSVDAVLEAALSTGDVRAGLAELASQGRVAVHVTKVNTAGSYFVLVTALGVGLAVLDRQRRLWWLAATAVSAAGLWLTASLAAILPGLGVAIAASFAWLRGTAGRRRGRLAVTLAAVLTLTTIGIARASTRPDASTSFRLRWAITQVSLATAADRPLFGVGIGEYALRSQPHVTEVVRAGYGEGRIEAHNYLLQIGAELGFVGLGLFLWALVATFGHATSAAAGAARPLAWAASAGLLAFLLSALAGQPMLVDSVAIPVWLVMGVLVGAAPPAPPRERAAWVPVGAAAILLTVPLRMQAEVKALDFALAAHGTTAEVDERGRDIHVLSGPARLFVSASDEAIELEAGSRLASEAGDVFVRIAGEGVTAPPLLLQPGSSRTVCVPVDSSARRKSGPRALDVTVHATSGAAAAAGSAWIRVVGLARPCTR